MKETCDEFLEACLKMFISGIKKLNFVVSSYSRKWEMNWLLENKLLQCAYLPSRNGPIPCFYKPVTCESPKKVTNAIIINGAKLKETRTAMSQIQYECFDGFKMEGNGTVNCQYSGQWDKMPKCLERKDKGLNGSNQNHPLIIVVPLLVIPLLALIIAHVIRTFICPVKNSYK